MSLTPGARRIAAVLPSLTDVMFLMPIVFLFSRMEGAGGMLEGDTGWHLRTGEWILANGRVPSVDFFSYTRPGETWYAWEWLWDVAFALLHRHAGMAAVIIGSMLLICLTSALLFRLAVRSCGFRLPAALFAFVGVAASTLHWLARPHLFTLLFTVMTLWVLEWKRSGERNWLWTLPVLTVFWVNLHGGFIVILLLLACYAGGEAAGALLESEPDIRRRFLRQGLAYSAALLGCLAASLVNPYGYHLHAHILRYVSNPDSPFFRYVSEWQSMSFHMPVARYIEILMVTSLLASFWHVTRRRFAYALLAVGWLHLGLVSARHMPIFAIVTAPFTAQAAVEIARSLAAARLNPWMRRVLESLRSVDGEFSTFDRLPRLYLLSLAGFILVAAAITAPQAAGKLRPDYPEKKYPAKAIASLPESALAGNVFADDEWGDYLIYRRYPKAKVFIDGRFDFYGGKFTEEYLEILGGKFDWERKLRKYQVDAVLISAGSHLASTLKESGRWVPVYDDGVAILFHTRERIARVGVPTTPRSADRGKPARGGEESPTARNNNNGAKCLKGA